jgi:GrpB-like predicted nucleotidyltransferase (UPF0157 family)
MYYQMVHILERCCINFRTEVWRQFFLAHGIKLESMCRIDLQVHHVGSRNLQDNMLSKDCTLIVYP